MEVSNSRWVVMLVIAGAIVLTVLLAILVPVIYYGGNPNPGAGVENSQWVAPSRTATQDQSVLIMAQTSSATTPIVPTATLDPNCTHSAIYWVYNLDSWPDQIIQGNLFYSSYEAQRLIQSTSVDVSGVLLIQYLAAYLSIAHGADPFEIEGVMVEAGKWLYEHPPGSVISDPDAQQAFLTAGILEDFNTGVIGPGRCPDDLIALAGQIARIPVPVLSITPEMVLSTYVPTATPKSPTPTMTSAATLVRVTVVPPTATEKPERDDDPDPTRRPTREPRPTEPPEPTDEPPPPPQETEPPPPP